MDQDDASRENLSQMYPMGDNIVAGSGVREKDQRDRRRFEKGSRKTSDGFTLRGIAWEDRLLEEMSLSVGPGERSMTGPDR